jgi:hypothetical protein
MNSFVSPETTICKGSHCFRAYARKRLRRKGFSYSVSPVRGVSPILKDPCRPGGEYQFPRPLYPLSGDQLTGLQGLQPPLGSPRSVQRSRGLTLDDPRATTLIRLNGWPV